MKEQLTNEELRKAAQPLIDVIRKYSQTLHMKIIVEEDYVEICEGVRGLAITEEKEETI